MGGFVMSRRCNAEFLEELRLAEIFLRKKYPKAFIDGFTQPLAVGIHRVLIRENPEIRKFIIREFIRRYTKTNIYLAMIGACQYRINLDGSTARKVSPKSRQYAETILDFRRQSSPKAGAA